MFSVPRQEVFNEFDRLRLFGGTVCPRNLITMTPDWAAETAEPCSATK